jgi:hypothetical protein
MVISNRMVFKKKKERKGGWKEGVENGREEN